MPKRCQVGKTKHCRVRRTGKTTPKKGKRCPKGSFQMCKEPAGLTSAQRKRFAKQRATFTRVRRRAGASQNPWVKHVKAYARRNGVSYKTALTRAKSSYRR